MQRNKELKSEPVDIEEYFKYKEEDNLAEHMDIAADPVQQYTCNNCSFRTTEEDCLLKHMRCFKNIEHLCEECNFKTLLECSMNEHLRIHHQIDKKCNFKTPQIITVIQLLKAAGSRGSFVCNQCGFEMETKRALRTHFDNKKCKEGYYKTSKKCGLKKQMRNEFKCKECKYKTHRERNLNKHMKKIHTDNELKCKKCD